MAIAAIASAATGTAPKSCSAEAAPAQALAAAAVLALPTGLPDRLESSAPASGVSGLRLPVRLPGRRALDASRLNALAGLGARQLTSAAVAELQSSTEDIVSAAVHDVAHAMVQHRAEHRAAEEAAAADGRPSLFFVCRRTVLIGDSAVVMSVPRPGDDDSEKLRFVVVSRVSKASTKIERASTWTVTAAAAAGSRPRLQRRGRPGPLEPPATIWFFQTMLERACARAVEMDSAVFA